MPPITPRTVPIVHYGTISGHRDLGAGRIRLSFLAVAPLVIIPMNVDAFTTEHGDKMYEMDNERARKAGEKVFEIASRLVGTEGLDRLWITPSNVILEIDVVHRSEITEKALRVMQKALGEIRFAPTAHGEAAPLIFDFKKLESAIARTAAL